MVFSSAVFLFYFFPLVLLGYFLLHKCLKAANIFLLLASLLFYTWGEPSFVLVMIAAIVFNYICALLIAALPKNAKRRTFLLCFAILGNTSVLFFYKYLDFFIANINTWFRLDLAPKGLLLPIGISFFTFQAMSYVVDVYRGNVVAQRKIQNVGLYIALFPQLIAGPIVRYKTIAEQIVTRKMTLTQFSDGMHHFLIGLGKKILLANQMALLADTAFSVANNERSFMLAWLGAIGYSLQILFDFSGYSDMAIGLGKMFGFDFEENFRYPYISKSISEFWRRWHISLGQWFRDYVYIPLGGSHVISKRRLVFNLAIVWLLTGFWHGANWTFVLWGVFYGVLVIFEKLTNIPERFDADNAFKSGEQKENYARVDKWKRKTKAVAYRVFTLLCILIGWVLFRAEGINSAAVYLTQMFGISNLFTDNHFTFVCGQAIMLLRERWVLLAAALLCSTPIFKYIGNKIQSSRLIFIRVAGQVGFVIFYVFIFFWSVSFIILGSHDPFIYFNF